MENENQNVIGVMTNLADSGQEEFVQGDSAGLLQRPQRPGR